MNPDRPINVNLALSISSRNLQISAYNNSYIASTGTISEVSSSSSVLVAPQAYTPIRPVVTCQAGYWSAQASPPGDTGVRLDLSVHFKAAEWAGRWLKGVRRLKRLSGYRVPTKSRPSTLVRHDAISFNRRTPAM
jgi:hypothetical protein